VPDWVTWTDHETGIRYRPVGEKGAWVSSLNEYFAADRAARVFRCGPQIWPGPREGEGVFSGALLLPGHRLIWSDSNGNLSRLAPDGETWEVIAPPDAAAGRSHARRPGPQGHDPGFWILDDGDVMPYRGGRWVGLQQTQFLPTERGFISSDKLLRVVPGRPIPGQFQEGRWFEGGSGAAYAPVDRVNGIWLGPGGKVFRVGADSRFYSPNGEIWEGPVHRELFRRESRPRSGLLSPNEKIMFVRPRAQTPPFPVRYKRRPVRWKTPPLRTPPRLYVVPPPNIVIDRRRLVELIAYGEVQLMPLMRRLGMDADGPECARFIVNSRAHAAKPVNEPMSAKAERRMGIWAEKLGTDLVPIPPLRLPRGSPPPRARPVLRQAEAPQKRAGLDLTNPFRINRLVRPVLLVKSPRSAR
jgi:hypothetical protein